MKIESPDIVVRTWYSTKKLRELDQLWLEKKIHHSLFQRSEKLVSHIKEKSWCFLMRIENASGIREEGRRPRVVEPVRKGKKKKI